MTSSKSRYRWQPIAAVAVIFGLLPIGIHSTGASADGTATASKFKTVRIVNFAFKPATLAIAKGDSVSFSNSSSTSHTATRNSAFDTGRIKPATAVAIRFKQKGTFAYHCTIHPSMHGKIVVN